LRNKLQICPYLEAADQRCAQRFTLEKLDEAYRFCFGSPERCSIYRMLSSEAVLVGAAPGSGSSRLTEQPCP